jgi:hypothetical protein
MCESGLRPLFVSKNSKRTIRRHYGNILHLSRVFKLRRARHSRLR